MSDGPTSSGAGPGRPTTFSVLVTVLDDREGLAELLAALTRQRRPADEIVVVDGGSTDGTLELLERHRAQGLPVRMVSAPGTNIAEGRNVGVRAATGEWIAVTDAGCRPEPGWLEAFARETRAADLLAGIYVVRGESPLERSLALALYPAAEEIGAVDPHTRLWQRLFGKRFEKERASTRSLAFTPEAWAGVGGFPEHIYAGEDPAFSLAAVERGLRLGLVPDAAVTWRPRPTWTQNARMYRSYARGSVRLDTPTRHLLRAGTWSAASLLALRGGALARLAVLAWVTSYLSLPVRRARRVGFPLREWWRLPAAIAVKDLSQVLGALLGLGDALRQAPQPSERRARA